MPDELIDTHCHVNIAEYFPDPAPAIEAARDAGVTRLIVVGLDVETSRRAIELSERYEGVYAIVGHHPNSAAEYKTEDLCAICDLLEHPKAVALGEIGLDFHHQYATREQQMQALMEQYLECPVDKPVVFHCREAYDELLDFIECYPKKRYLFHCFSGTAEHARRALQDGAILGFDGPLTYKKNNALREMVAALPRDRIVIETDSPFMTPEPYRSKPNEPAMLPLINEALANALGITPSESAQLTTQNAEAFFCLPRSARSSTITTRGTTGSSTRISGGRA